jgi:hypothetical protein
MLHELAEMGMDIARALHRQATAEPAAPEAQPAAPAPSPASQCAPQRVIAASAAFDRIARTVRRTIALARKLSEPDREQHSAAQSKQQSARQRIIDIRDYARMTDDELDELDEHLGGPDLDAPDLDDDDYSELSTDEAIAAIRRDLGLPTLPGTPPCKPRAPGSVPDDVPGVGPPPTPRVPPQGLQHATQPNTGPPSP